MRRRFQDSGKRTDDEDLDIFITTLQIHLQSGGDLSEIVDAIFLKTIREHRRLEGGYPTQLISQKDVSLGNRLTPSSNRSGVVRDDSDYMGTMLDNTMGLIMLGICRGE